MTKSTCTVDGCDRQHYCRKLCKMHYSRLLKTGQTEIGRPPLEQRLWRKVDKGEGCWTWAGGKDGAGYGRIALGKTNVLTHRVAWELANGPIPDGMVIDHKCHNRICVRPDHLRLATNKQNGENRKGPSASNVSSGVRGVHKADKKWAARLGHNGKVHHLGCFPTIEEAEAVVIEARRRIFTHSQD